LLTASASAALLAGREGWSQQTPSTPSTPSTPKPTTTAPKPDSNPPLEARAAFTDPDRAPPPPSSVSFLQYGVAFTAEVVTAAGPICDNEAVPCILGPGGGIAVRAGWRGPGPLYLGGAYELSKQDPNKLYRLAILQQARAEGRWYFQSARDVEPFGTAGAGVAGYGDEWGVDTFGPLGHLGGGVEAQITRRTVVGVALCYRLMWFKAFTDTSGADRSAGIAQIIGLDLLLEQRDPIVKGSQAAE
jgi:hypothetical protein